jgi:hypothetical protein
MLDNRPKGGGNVFIGGWSNNPVKMESIESMKMYIVKYIFTVYNCHYNTNFLQFIQRTMKGSNTLKKKQRKTEIRILFTR